MKQAVVNGRWNLWLPDSIADWDAITGDYSARQGWEFCRFESIQQHHRYGDYFFDVGAEHGWISAILAREFVGASNMVLFEPSCEFWVNIRKTWVYNGLDDPAACFQGFVDETSTSTAPPPGAWPSCASSFEPEIGGMPYGSLLQPEAAATPSIRLDDFAWSTGIFPASINIDVEGAELRVLFGAKNLLIRDMGLVNVWVSVHRDLMEAYHHKPSMLNEFMARCGWEAYFLGEDHEAHVHFTRKT